MSVLDNVRVGRHARSRSDFFSDALQLPWVRRQEAALDAGTWELIESLDLQDAAHRLVTDLPSGTQKRVELARALAAEPEALAARRAGGRDSTMTRWRSSAR